MKIKLISDVYQKETVDVRIKTRVLQVILSMVVLALVLAIAKNIFVLHKVPLAVFETVLGLCTAAVIYFQYYGHYRFAWRFTLAFAFVIGIPVILQRAESSTLDVMYILFASSIIVILLSNFALNKIDFILCTDFRILRDGFLKFCNSSLFRGECIENRHSRLDEEPRK